MSTRPPQRQRSTIPEYSATGDVLAYRTCALQYRFYNRNRLPPSRPVQIWFGEFIHGVLEEAFRRWKTEHPPFPWEWLDHIRPIELALNKELLARGIPDPPGIFCRFENSHENYRGNCPDHEHPHKLLASQRVEAAINHLGPWLFPLISEAEVRLRGTRRLPQPSFRAEAYSVTGVADVLATRHIDEHLLDMLPKTIRTVLSSLSRNAEIIVDYKGTRRPALDQPEWKAHELQILTYAWLRNQQVGESRVEACLLLYLNELVPSRDDLVRLQQELLNNTTDVKPDGNDRVLIGAWGHDQAVPTLSPSFRLQRCIRVIEASPNNIHEALHYFDNTVLEIEKKVQQEMLGAKILENWDPRYRHETCVACDFVPICPHETVRERLARRG